MLDDEKAAALAEDLWSRHQAELPRFERIHGYHRGVLGVPDLPDGANDELKELAVLAVKNVLSVVVDSFAQNLSVVGYRTVDAAEDETAWTRWQQQRMDARQTEVIRSALKYGLGYGAALPGDDGSPTFRLRSPRQMFAAYADPTGDAWPVYALETWLDTSGRVPHRYATLLDETHSYTLDFGELRGVELARHRGLRTDSANARRLRPGVVEVTEDPVEHGGVDAAGDPVCPVVRFVNARDAEDVVVGEVEPLIRQQRAINAVNFDRLVVSRFGAFPQRYVIGWTADANTVLKASMSRVWTFEDSKEEVAAGAFPAAPIEPYNALLEEMLQHVAMQAQVSPAQVTGKLVNLSAEALAAAEASQQRKTKEKRTNLGESFEQLLALSGRMAGEQVDESAEVVWADTEARSFAAVVDGIQKLSAAGVPLDQLLPSIPGWTQQQVKAATQRLTDTGTVVSTLQQMQALAAGLPAADA